MRYNYDKQGNLDKVTWCSLQDAVNKKTGKKMWINSQEYIDKQVKKHYNDALRIAKTIKTSLLTDADKESYALEGLYEAAGTYDPTHIGKKRGETASFRTYLMLRIRSVILREKTLASMKKRCVSVEVSNENTNSSPYSDFPEGERKAPELELGDNKERKKKVSYRYLQDIPNSATNDRYDEDSKTYFDRYVEPTQEMPFDLVDVIEKLKASQNKPSELQLKILTHFMDDGMNGSDIARELGVSRQAVNLHLIALRKKLKEVLAAEAPMLKLGE